MKSISLALLLTLVSCFGSDSGNSGNNPNSSGTQLQRALLAPYNKPCCSSSKKWVQIERLGRPGINEALVLDNDKLIAFNSIPPTFDLAVDNPTVLSVLQQAATALNLFDSLDGADQFANDFSNKVVQGFLPDVMRIDVNAPITVGKWAIMLMLRLLLLQQMPLEA